jgi:hypothetical protein
MPGAQVREIRKTTNALCHLITAEVPRTQPPSIGVGFCSRAARSSSPGQWGTGAELRRAPPTPAAEFAVNTGGCQLSFPSVAVDLMLAERNHVTLVAVRLTSPKDQ